MKKVLISACIVGMNVRWNGANKHNKDVQQWALENGIELIPVCPENELFGTPRPPIKVLSVSGEVKFKMPSVYVCDLLEDKSKEIYGRYMDASGFIGISGSPSCGKSVGVKGTGEMTRGFMHITTQLPTVEIGNLKSEACRAAFLRKLR